MLRVILTVNFSAIFVPIHVSLHHSTPFFPQESNCRNPLFWVLKNINRFAATVSFTSHNASGKRTASWTAFANADHAIFIPSSFMSVPSHLLLFISAVTVRSTRSQRIHAHKICCAARLAHGVIQMAHGRGQVGKSQLLHQGADAAFGKTRLIAAAVSPPRRYGFLRRRTSRRSFGWTPSYTGHIPWNLCQNTLSHHLPSSFPPSAEHFCFFWGYSTDKTVP